MGKPLQFCVMNETTGSLMGWPNTTFDSLEAAKASLAWLSQEQDRKRHEHETDPNDEEKRHAWAQVATHSYVIRWKERTPWNSLDDLPWAHHNSDNLVKESSA